jgi:hypothetical protein
MSEGWTCPVCRRGVAPAEKTCDHGGPRPLVKPSPSRRLLDVRGAQMTDGLGRVSFEAHRPMRPGRA